MMPAKCSRSLKAGRSRVSETGEYLLLWVRPRDGIATDAIRGNGGAWMLRYWDGRIHDRSCNFDLTERTGPALLARWACGQLGYPVTLTRTDRPRWWVPPRFRDCGETTVYGITPATGAGRPDE